MRLAFCVSLLAAGTGGTERHVDRLDLRYELCVSRAASGNFTATNPECARACIEKAPHRSS